MFVSYLDIIPFRYIYGWTVIQEIIASRKERESSDACILSFVRRLLDSTQPYVIEAHQTTSQIKVRKQKTYDYRFGSVYNSQPFDFYM